MLDTLSNVEVCVDATEKTICELRNSLTFISSYRQMIEQEHPEAVNYKHWEELHENLDEMASRLASYERALKSE